MIIVHFDRFNFGSLCLASKQQSIKLYNLVLPTDNSVPFITIIYAFF